jgi:copper homeostasis protein
MTFEICGDGLDAVLLAEKYKVKRVELCSALSLGGLTPSVGLMQECCAVKDVEIHVMIRHREGGFVYDAKDIEIMETDIISAAEAGAKGVVFGCLTEQNEVDHKQNKLLCKLAMSLGLEVTFHRAFDFCTDYAKSLEDLIDIGFDRLLTSGLAPDAEKGISTLAAICAQANGRIQIMAGGGLNAKNAELIALSGVDALHFTVHHKVTQDNLTGMGSESRMNEEKLRSIVELFS